MRKKENQLHDYNLSTTEYCETNQPSGTDVFFNNLIKAKQLAKVLGISIATIYDWKYRGKMRNVPDDLFKKIGGTLYVRKDILMLWMSYRQSSFQKEVLCQ